LIALALTAYEPALTCDVSSVENSSSQLREALQRIAERPGMCMLQENYRQVVAFVWGCIIASPEDFKHLNDWIATRLRGAHEKFGWPFALGVLAADRVSRRKPDGDETEMPLVQEFLRLVCEYLDEFGAADGPACIQAEYERVRRDYVRAHDAAHSNGTILNSDRWHEECEEFHVAYVPALLRATNPSNPWGE
jgi:hypothetical protein